MFKITRLGHSCELPEYGKLLRLVADGVGVFWRGVIHIEPRGDEDDDGSRKNQEAELGSEQNRGDVQQYARRKGCRKALDDGIGIWSC